MDDREFFIVFFYPGYPYEESKQVTGYIYDTYQNADLLLNQMNEAEGKVVFRRSWSKVQITEKNWKEFVTC